MASLKTRKQAALLPGYISTLDDSLSKERYREKLKFIGGKDPYEIPMSSWQDDVDKWPSTNENIVILWFGHQRIWCVITAGSL